MSSAPDLTRLVPGFEFLQNLMKGAGASIPGMSQWIAPTLDPEEIDKRIQELKTVQFWLEQNARLLATTIQALEVQRMTLATLQTMNLPMSDLRDALTARPGAAAAAPAPARRPEPAPAPEPEPEPEPAPAPRKAAAPAARSAAPAVDPMQWWAALTQQFTDIAAQALKDSAGAADPARPATARPPQAAAAKKKPPARKRAAG